MRILHVGDDSAATRPCGLTLYADALMRAEAERGHEVGYVFSGRYYPRLTGPRLKRWRSGSVRMFELVNASSTSHWEAGTRAPLRDLEDRAADGAFAVALREMRPDVVHVHELARLPSSVLEVAHAEAVPVAFTLHDYKPLCASVRLLDADGARCLRHDVGVDCARNCAGAPSGYDHLIEHTLAYERRRARRAVPIVRDLDFSALERPIRVATRMLVNRAPGAQVASGVGGPAASGVGAPPADYQRRRDVNVERLNRCDRLIAPSARVAGIYVTLGVDPDRISVQRLTLPHLARLRPRRDAEVHAPLTFVALGAGASPSKGSRLLTAAVESLEAQGLPYRLILLGAVEDDVRRRLAAVPSVVLAGAYSPDDIDEALEEADLGLMVSTWEEAHGFVGIEMLAKGLPVIGNALGGITEYVREGVTGWLNRDASVAGLVQLMAAAIADPDRVRRMRQSVRNHHGEIARPMGQHVEEVEALYDEVLAARAMIASPAARRSSS